MAPYCMSIVEHEDMSQDTSANDLFSDDDDDDLLEELPSLPLIPVPDILPTEHSLPQLLAQSCGDEDLHEVTSVKLKVVASQVNLQRLHIYLPRLQQLDLSGSHLVCLRPLGYGLESLRVLRVGRCSLSSLDGVFGLSHLTELHAPHNAISDLGLLATLLRLIVLDLRSNPITSLQQVGFLSMCEALRELTLAECPVAELPGYKACVVTTLPGLGLLDGCMLAEGGTDICQEGKSNSFDRHDDDDGPQTLGVESLKIQEEADQDSELQPEMPVVGGSRRSRLLRPATVSGARPSQPGYMVRDRPATAAAKHNSDTRLAIHTDPDMITDDAVSKLTSGRIVCGNLAAALRGKHRQRKAAWDTKDSDLGPHGRNGLTVEGLYAAEATARVPGAGDAPTLTQPLLDASRRWREAYHSFRQSHKEKWEEEEREEGTEKT